MKSKFRQFKIIVLSSVLTLCVLSLDQHHSHNQTRVLDNQFEKTDKPADNLIVHVDLVNSIVHCD